MKTKLFFSISFTIAMMLSCTQKANAQKVEKLLPNLVKKARFETQWAKPNPTPDDIKNSTTINFKKLNYTELAPLLIIDLQEQQDLIDTQEQQISELKQKIEMLSASIHTRKTNRNFSASVNALASGAYLEQNMPNPFSNTSSIGYYIPEGFKQAQLQITDMAGGVLKTYAITQNGYARQTISNNALTSGVYEYSLWVDGKLVDTKPLVLAK